MGQGQSLFSRMDGQQLEVLEERFHAIEEIVKEQAACLREAQDQIQEQARRLGETELRAQEAEDRATSLAEAQDQLQEQATHQLGAIELRAQQAEERAASLAEQVSRLDDIRAKVHDALRL